MFHCLAKTMIETIITENFKRTYNQPLDANPAKKAGEEVRKLCEEVWAYMTTRHCLYLCSCGVSLIIILEIMLFQK